MKQTEMKHMEIYNKLAMVPQEATKPIEAGRLKGMTSISPMWRIKVMTETFGQCGVGWKLNFDETKVVNCETTGEELVIVKSALYTKNENGEWSEPVYGFGTSKLLAKEAHGMYFDPEAFKKAQTDAFGSAAKYLGVGGSVYLEEDNTHPAPEPVQPKLKYEPVGKKLEDDEIISEEQAMHVTGCILKEGKQISAVIGYINATPKRNNNKITGKDEEAIKQLTYGEYISLLYMFSGFKKVEG